MRAARHPSLRLLLWLCGCVALRYRASPVALTITRWLQAAVAVARPGTRQRFGVTGPFLQLSRSPDFEGAHRMGKPRARPSYHKHHKPRRDLEAVVRVLERRGHGSTRSATWLGRAGRQVSSWLRYRSLLHERLRARSERERLLLHSLTRRLVVAAAALCRSIAAPLHPCPLVLQWLTLPRPRRLLPPPPRRRRFSACRRPRRRRT